MRHSIISAGILVSMALISGQALGADVNPPSSTPPTVSLTKLVTQLPVGLEMQIVQAGAFCTPVSLERADGRIMSADLGLFGPAFSEAFGNSELATANKPIDLFGSSKNQTAADYQVGGIIRDFQVKICSQGILGTKSESRISIEWQVYSASKGAVVQTIVTSGFAKINNLPVSSASKEIARASFTDSVSKFANSPEMKELLSYSEKISRPDSINDSVKIEISNSDVSPRSISESVGSVVLVHLGDAFGSGVLISTDGYILTNEHVVGRAKAVRIRWSDGFETTGTVVRTHIGRDVALIKTDPRGREPLPLRVGRVQPGETVLAIGAPLDKAFQGTVTRGVVSANRIDKGYSFIQSDVIINHGNSGGPLLDEKGYVIGLADLVIQFTENIPMGLNFFIPIKDALDFLNVDLPPATAVPDPPPVQKASGPAAKSKSVAR